MTEVHKAGGVALRARTQASERRGQPWGDVEAASGTAEKLQTELPVATGATHPCQVMLTEAPSHSTSLPLAPPVAELTGTS